MEETVKTVLEMLNQSGFSAFLAGGAVRDILLGINPADYDVTTSAAPNEIKRVFNGFKQYNIGEKYGTVTVEVNNIPFEITTFRKETGYADNRHPDVLFTKSEKQDVLRRDFTVNALLMDKDGNIYDYVGGKDDIKNKILRTVGKPHDRFFEDPLRILRAVRFSASFNLTPENETLKAVKELAGSLTKISRERITEEMLKTVQGDILWAQSTFPEVFTAVFGELPNLNKNINNFTGETKKYLYFLSFSDIKIPLNALIIPKAEKKKAEFLFKYAKTETPAAVLYYYGEKYIKSLIEIKSALGLKTEHLIFPPPVYKISHLCIEPGALPVPEKDRGKALETLLFAVINGKAKNTKTDLINYIKENF